MRSLRYRVVPQSIPFAWQTKRLSLVQRAASSNAAVTLQEDLVSLCKRRGFVFPGSDLYGGLANSYDYGPLGAQMKKNIQDRWWKDFVQRRSDCVALDSSTVLNPKVWEASGHIQNFTDPMTECANCHSRIRADKLIEDCESVDIQEAGGLGLEDIEEIIQTEKIRCPNCDSPQLSSPRHFNLLFKTSFGVTEDTSDDVYLRPETAQGAYINYHAVQTSMRRKLPFGIGQAGKSFRNEISPGNFIFRTREFEQLELQYFCSEQDATKWAKYWVEYCENWLKKYGLSPLKFRRRVHDQDELAHYAVSTVDIEYEFPFGWSELWGIANRGNYDLNCHMMASGKDLTYFDASSKMSFLPHVIEPALGLGRLMLAMLVDAYAVEKVDGKERTVLRLHPDIAPYQIAVLPLSKKAPLIALSESIFDQLASLPDQTVDYDVTGSIGKRYRRQDEIGTPLCVTVDFESLEDEKVTLRARDSMKQIRLSVKDLVAGNYDYNTLNDDVTDQST